MPSVSDLQSRLDSLKAARDSGVLTVRHGDTFTTFRDLGEIQRIIGEIETEIAQANGTAKARRPRYIRQRRKGL